MMTVRMHLIGALVRKLPRKQLTITKFFDIVGEPVRIRL